MILLRDLSVILTTTSLLPAIDTRGRSKLIWFLGPLVSSREQIFVRRRRSHLLKGLTFGTMLLSANPRRNLVQHCNLNDCWANAQQQQVCLMRIHSKCPAVWLNRISHQPFHLRACTLNNTSTCCPCSSRRILCHSRAPSTFGKGQNRHKTESRFGYWRKRWRRYHPLGEIEGKGLHACTPERNHDANFHSCTHIYWRCG